MKKVRRPKEKEEDIKPQIDEGMEIDDGEQMEAGNRVKIILEEASKSNPLNKLDPKEKKYHVTKQKKPKNEVDQWVEDMIKAEISDLTKIQNFFASPSIRRQITINEAKFYQDLINSTAYNTRLSVTDLLHGANFNYYLGVKSFGFKSNVFTNDRLFWISKLSIRLKKRRIYPFLKLSDNNVSLQTLAVAQDKGYRKGYIQDYEEDFSCIGLESLTAEERQKLKDTETFKQNDIKYYFYNNKEYGCLRFPSGCVITFLKDEIDNVVDKIKKVKVLGNKKNLTNEIKLYKLKAGKSVYISQNLNLTDFFPCEIITSNPLTYGFLFKFDIDMLAFENHLRANFNYKNDEGFDSFFQFYDLVQWNTFDLMVNFLIVEKMTTYKEGDDFADFRKSVENFISQYNDIKRDVRTLRQIIEKTIRMLVRFFDSFPTRIKFAKIQKFNDPARDLKEKLQAEIRKGTPEKFEFLLRDYKLFNTCATIFNSVKNNCSILEGILIRFNSLLLKIRLKQGGTIEKDAKKLGVEIYNIFDFLNNKNFLVDVIRTPSLFLGNLLEDNEEFNKGIKDEAKKMDKKYELYQKENERIEEILKVNPEDCIKRLITIYFYTKDEISDNDFETDGNKTILKNDFAEWYDKDIKKARNYPNGEFYKKMAVYGARLLLSGAVDLEEVEIDQKTEKNLGYLIDQYNVFANKNKIEDQLAINENQEMINKLEKENRDLKENKKDYLRPGEAVTVDFMKEHNIDIIDDDNNEEYMNFVNWARDNGVTDDILLQALNSGDYDYKQIMRDQNPDLIKDLQEQTLDKYGKGVDNEEEMPQEDQKEEAPPQEEEKKEDEKEEEISTTSKSKPIFEVKKEKPHNYLSATEKRKKKKQEEKAKKEADKRIRGVQGTGQGGNKGGKNKGKK